MLALGLDFGTTNSAVAVCRDDAGRPTVLRHRLGPDSSPVFRSVLFFPRYDEWGERVRPDTAPLAGPAAVRRYLEGYEGRFVQSAKSFLASRTFEGTRIHGRTWQLPDLVAALLRPLLASAGVDQLRLADATIALGRPVRYVNAETDEDDRLAVSRMRSALSRAGFDDARDVQLILEPVAAAWTVEAELDRDELVLIGDFGGGTSDFTLIELGPGRSPTTERAVWTAGVGRAGDAFDAALIHRTVSPALGLGSSVRDPFDGRLRPVPHWLYKHLRRWHHLSFLNTPENLETLDRLRAQSVEPERLDALRWVVEEELGYRLHRRIEAAKVALSETLVGRVFMEDGPLLLDETVTRDAFEAWSAPVLREIETTVAGLLERARVRPADIDRVFLTGGTSHVPAVRAIFERLVGTDAVAGDGALTTVATGLAQIAREMAR